MQGRCRRVGILPIAARSAATALAGAGLPLKGHATDAVSSITLHQCRPSPVAATCTTER